MQYARSLVMMPDATRYHNLHPQIPNFSGGGSQTPPPMTGRTPPLLYSPPPPPCACGPLGHLPLCITWAEACSGLSFFCWQLTNWYSESRHQQQGAYLQWKPVCYKSSARQRATATKVKLYKLQPGEVVYNSTLHNDSVSPLNLGLAYYGNLLYTGDYAMRATNVSFGLSKDKFYKDTNYTTWWVA